MFEKILVPTDFSKYSQKVVECVKELPGLKELVILHVIGPSDPLARVWDPGARIEEAKKRLAEQKTMIERQGLQIKVRDELMFEGEISRKIQDVADEESVSLIALGARGKGLVEGILLGNVAKELLRYGNTNILLMHYNVLEGREGPDLDKFCSQPFSKVLCPNDFSMPSTEALSLIQGMDGLKEIVLQHVISQGETWKEIDARKAVAEETLRAIGKEIEREGLKVKVNVSAGNPVEEICDLARKEGVSLIAMSAHGKGWLEQLTVGSTTYDVARMSDRPVIVVRAIQNA